MNERDIFIALLQKEAPADRQAYLDEACKGNDDLRRGVLALLKVHDRAGSFLESPVADLVSAVDTPLPERAGSVIGSYKLLEQIGEGGFGVVFMAEQQQPVRRKVALKVLKPGMDTKQVVARFEAERQALALMDHPHIAHVLDAGATDSGRPYFVMELIRGIAITAFCDDNQLTLRERLQLFVTVCQAVQHAHQKGIIHRDLKPSNVLVTLLDGTPVVKVIDFGIAKALGQERLTDKTLFTGFVQLIGTPLYMSPEQAEMSGQDVDTRTDIYALGVLLYELLTGTTPFDKERLKEASYDEIRRIIREEEPAKPSTRISTLGQAATTVSANRKSELRRLSQMFRGELDWIVMKALDKDRDRRYETASSLAADVQRYLDDEPVQACPPSAGYRFRKFARKYWMPVTVATAFVLLLVAGVVVSTWQALRATEAEQQALAQAERADREAQIAGEQEKRIRQAKRDSDHRYYASEMKLASLNAEAGHMNSVHRRLDELEHHGASDPELRGFEWYYLQRLRQLDLRTLKGHRSWVWGVAYSPDGRRIASGSWDNTVKVWDAATGKCLRALLGHTDRVWGVAYSPDCRHLASASTDGTVKVWDLTTGKEHLTLQGHTARVFDVAYSPDGRRVASASWDGTVKVWDAATGEKLLDLKEHTNLVSGVAYSPDGHRLASASWDNTVKVWDADTGECLRTLEEGHTDAVRSVAFSPDGRHLASASQDQTVKVWDLITRNDPLTLKGHTGWVTAVRYSPDGRRIASASEDQAVKVWDATTGKELLTLKGHTGAVNSVAFSPDGRCLASTSNDRTVKVWDAASAQECLTLPGHASQVSAIAYSPDGCRLASASWDRSLKVWDAVTGQELRTLNGHPGDVTAVAYSPDGRCLASASADGAVKVWDAATGKCLRTLLGHTDRVWGVAYSPDGRHLASASADRTVMVWDASSGQELLTLKGHNNGVWDVAYSPDGRRLASAGRDMTVRVWDAATGHELRTFKGHRDQVFAVTYSPDGRRLASGSWDGTVKVGDAETGQIVLDLEGSMGQAHGVVYSPDGHRLATARPDGTVKVWDATTGQELLTLKGHTGAVNSVAFSPDGRCIASAGADGTVKIWDATALTPQRLIEREARGLVQFLLAKPLPPDEAAAAIRRDPTITEAVRQQALAWVEPFWHSQVRYEAARVVEPLFEKPLLRSDVLATIRANAGLSEPVRQEALKLAETLPENAPMLNKASEAVVVWPGADAGLYRRGLLQAEAACRLAPNDAEYRNTLGLAYYRMGKYREAVAELEKSLSGHAPLGLDALDLYILSMCRYRLGNAAEARECFERAKDSQQRNAARLSPEELGELQQFRSEAETLLEKPAESR